MADVPLLVELSLDPLLPALAQSALLLLEVDVPFFAQSLLPALPLMPLLPIAPVDPELPLMPLDPLLP